MTTDDFQLARTTLQKLSGGQRDVVMRRTVETVTPHAFLLVELVRQTVEKRLARQGGVESGVEDRDMRHSRKVPARFADAEEIDRIVQRRERTERFEFSQDRVVDQRCTGEFLSA